MIEELDEIEQGTEDWFRARCGRPTASQFHRLAHPDGSAKRENWPEYALELLAASCSPDFPRPPSGSFDTRRGNDLEPRIRNRFGDIVKPLKVLPCGFRTLGVLGASPDAIIYEDRKMIAGAEFKAPRPKNQAAWLIGGGIPAEHMAQVHGGMVITGLDSWYFVSYCDGFDLHIVRANRSGYTRLLTQTLHQFAKFYKAYRDQYLPRCRGNLQN